MLTEQCRHPQPPAELGGDVEALGARDADVDLLQRDHIGLEAAQDVGDAVEIDDPIRAAAVMDVLGHHGQARGRARVSDGHLAGGGEQEEEYRERARHAAELNVRQP